MNIQTITKMLIKAGIEPNEVKKEMLNCSFDIQELDKKMYQLNESVKKYNDL